MTKSTTTRTRAISFLSLSFLSVVLPACESTTKTVCPEGQLVCAGRCMDPKVDRGHCGATGDCQGANAGTACAQGEICDGTGVCALSCQAWLTECSGVCVDLLRDRAHCGDCGTSCAPGLACMSGLCKPACPEGRIECDGVCVDPATDRERCGATRDCVGANAGVACTAGQVCNGAGLCEASCMAGLTDCGRRCVNTASDPAHCSACDSPCGLGEECVAGVCCPAGLIGCDGACIDPRSDPRNCGGCGVTCGPGVEACVDGACQCPAWKPTRCDGTCVDLLSDNENCGGCGTGCPSGDCFDGICGGTPTFKMTSYGNDGCVIYPRTHREISGEIRGGAAMGEDSFLYTGELATIRWSPEPNTLARWPIVADGIFGDLRTGRVYSLTRNGSLLQGCDGVIDGFKELNETSGFPAAAVQALSEPILVECGAAGLFAGLGRLVVYDGIEPARFWNIALATGEVTDLGEAPRLEAATCNSWAFWGVAEQFGGDTFVDYVANNGRALLRTSVSTGETTPITTYDQLPYMCSFSVAPRQGRWYWQAAGWGLSLPPAPDADEAIGYCEATWCGDVGCSCGASRPDRCGESCVDLTRDAQNCGTCDRACPAGAECQNGECLCTRERPTLCDGGCSDLGTDAANCGECGAACPTNGICVDGECACPAHAPLLCDGACVNPFSDSAHCGGCGQPCIAGDCFGGVCGGTPIFKIDTYSNENCQVHPMDHETLTGLEDGAMALGPNAVYYTGMHATLRWDLETDELSVFPVRLPALFGDLRSRRIYTLTRAGAPLETCEGEFDGFQEVDPDTGLLVGTAISLAEPLAISCGETGLFAGLGRLVVHDGLSPAHVWSIDLADGAVTDLGQSPALPHASCAGWAYWGIAEQFDDDVFVNYVHNSWTAIVRTSVSTGRTKPISSFSNISNACSFVFSPQDGRWYWHFAGSNESLPANRARNQNIGSCDIAWCAEGGCQCLGDKDDVCGLACVDLETDSRNCGACGGTCGVGRCANGACVCPAWSGMCSGTCVDLTSDDAHCGACDTPCPSGDCFAGQCGGVRRFKVVDYGTQACIAYPRSHAQWSGDDRGGIAANRDSAVYNGDSSAIFWDPETNEVTRWGSVKDGLFGDLRTGRVFTLTYQGAHFVNCNGSVDGFQELDPLTGEVIGPLIPLSRTITVSCSNTGVFSGVGRLLLHDGRSSPHVWDIALDSGAVTDKGVSPSLDRSSCENWAYWGIAEQFDGALYLNYVDGARTRILRTNPVTGATTPLAMFPNGLSDMCSFTASVQSGRWYWHFEGSSPTLGGNGDENLGACPLSWCGDDGCHCAAPRSLSCADSCVDPRTDTANCGGCGNVCPANETCVAGVCGCRPPNLECDGACVNPDRDPTNCGGCGNLCTEPTPFCGGGSCRAQVQFTGIQTNVPGDSLSGWNTCFTGTYAGASDLSTILTSCTGSYLMLACRPVGSATMTVVAYAPREDVLFNTGASNTPHVANGVGWYFSTAASWGFARLGDSITRNSCDTAGTNAAERLCWHTSSNRLTGGWRCGATVDLNGSTTWQRLVLQSDY